MRTDYDVCVIGGGILGCMAVRTLSQYDLRVVLLEKEADVCCGISKANSATIYPGYDHKPGTLKSRMCVSGNARMQQICEELQVPMKRCGSLMVGFGPRSEEVLRKKLEHGRTSDVPGLELLTGSEVLALEPFLNPSVTMGLYAPSTGTVNPWELGIAACENAMENGCQVYFHSEVKNIKKTDSCLELEIKDTVSGEYCSVRTKGILNCAGSRADLVREMLLPPSVRIRHTKGSYLVFSSYLKQKPEHVIFYEPEEKKKGLTLIPTTDGSLLAGATEDTADSIDDTSTCRTSLEVLKEKTKFLLPGIDFSELLCNFTGIRPNPYEVGEETRSIRSFVIDQPEECPQIVSLIGIKTPGMTCSTELAEYAVDRLFHGMGAAPEKKKYFKRTREAICSAESGRIVCHCNQVTEGEIREAIRRGADTLEAVKHRCRTGMGKCQGSRCTQKILAILQQVQEQKYEKL